jgi:hypothetical protein
VAGGRYPRGFECYTNRPTMATCCKRGFLSFDAECLHSRTAILIVLNVHPGCCHSLVGLASS